VPYHDLLGCFVTLPVRRFGPPGAFLALDAVETGPTILLPGAEIPEGTREGDTLDVFVYLDSADRPVATLQAPRLTLGRVAFLTATDIGRFGAFFDWGMPKELLVPYAEQTREVSRGDRHPIGLYLDDTGRLAGTMRVAEMLRTIGEFELDEWVEGEAWRKDPQIGIFVIVEKRFVGLIPNAEPTTLSRGDAGRFRVASILDDGKIELSLRGHGHEEVEGDAQRILARLAEPNAPRVSDRTTPEQIRAVFGLSKKSFKRAVGRLLKERAVTLDAQGFVLKVQR
jgi:hypothetical protein